MPTSTTAKYTLTIIVTSLVPINELYLVGDNKKLGSWEPSEAKAFKPVKNHPLQFILKLSIPKAARGVSFKLIPDKSWDHVELSADGNEISNRYIFVASYDTIVPLIAHNFR